MSKSEYDRDPESSYKGKNEPDMKNPVGSSGYSRDIKNKTQRINQIMTEVTEIHSQIVDTAMTDNTIEETRSMKDLDHRKKVHQNTKIKEADWSLKMERNPKVRTTTILNKEVMKSMNRLGMAMEVHIKLE